MPTRPTGVTVAAVIHFLEGILWIATALFLLTAFLGLAAIPELLTLRTSLGNLGLALAILPFAIGVLLLVVGWGLWSLQDWARITAVILSILILLGSIGTGIWTVLALVGVFPIVGVPSLLLLIIHAWMIYYLLQPHVRDAFAGLAYAQPSYVQTPYAPQMATAEPPTPIGVAAPAQAGYPPTAPQVAGVPGTIPPVPTAAPAPVATEILRKAPPQMAWLVSKTGLRAGKEFRLLEETRIGRDAAQNDVVIDDSAVGRQHAKIRLESGQWILYDLASTNGTFVNDQQIYRQPLTDGDVVRMGQTTFVFMELREKEQKEA